MSRLRSHQASSLAVAMMMLIPLILGFGQSLGLAQPFAADLASPAAAHATVGVSAGLA